MAYRFKDISCATSKFGISNDISYGGRHVRYETLWGEVGRPPRLARAFRPRPRLGRTSRHGRRQHDARGRMLAQGDLRLIALALIAEQPRHGYEIIKVLEDKTAGWYSPSPGIVYPTLTYLEEAGYVTAEVEGAKKRYAITDEGRAHLEENRDFVDAVLERLALIGERVARMRRRFGGDDDERRGMPP